jgi:hypothetical protein
MVHQEVVVQVAVLVTERHRFPTQQELVEQVIHLQLHHRKETTVEILDLVVMELVVVLVVVQPPLVLLQQILRAALEHLTQLVVLP